jgi:hypothetical protein
MAKRPHFGFKRISKFVKDVFKGDLHAKRQLSLANATLGVINSGSLVIHKIGHGLAKGRGLKVKHAIKQVDRLLSNSGIDVSSSFEYWVGTVIGLRTSIVVALDWTEFDADGQSTIALHLVTNHGRATPLIWKTVKKSKLKNRRNDYEDALLVQFKEILPPGVQVKVLADRGFGDHKLLEFLLNELGFSYVIRIRGNITVTSASGEQRPASDWVGKNGRLRTLRDATITGDHYPVPIVVCVHDKGMKEPWCIVASDQEDTGREIVKYYAKRWGIEPSFRDSKDLRFGMGLSKTHIRNTDRRDRLLLLNAFAIFLMTMLGAAGEALGLDKHLKANTVKYRTHSLFRQGCMLVELIITMSLEELRALMRSFRDIQRQHVYVTDVYFLV